MIEWPRLFGVKDQHGEPILMLEIPDKKSFTEDWSVVELIVKEKEVDEQKPQLKPPWDRDIRAELDTNKGPYTEGGLVRDGGWWTRRLDQIDKLTFHHTLSDSPHATARYYIKKGGGRPTLPYTIWVTQTGEVLLCVDLTAGLWHDHTGHENTHLSVGLAGSLHKNTPSDVQLDSAAKVAAWAILSDELPLIDDIDAITGHQDWITTQCPGWDTRTGNEASGEWKQDLFDRIEALIK